MDTKQLVEKFVNGEITEEQFDTETSKLSPEEQDTVRKEATTKAKEELNETVKKIQSARDGVKKIQQKADDNLATKMRQENFEEAKSKFFSEAGIDKAEDVTAFEEGFKKFDSGSVNVPNIIKDMKSYFASTKSDEFFDLKQKQKVREQDAEEYNAQNAGSNGSGGGEDPTKKISKEVKDYMELSRKAGRPITAEFAQRAITVAKNRGHIK